MDKNAQPKTIQSKNFLMEIGTSSEAVVIIIMLIFKNIGVILMPQVLVVIFNCLKGIP